MIYIFADFKLDSARKLLFRLPSNEKVPLTNKAFEVLLLLVENSGKLLTKDVLMAKVWKDSIVEEANLTQTISVLRKTLGENPDQHRFIVTETGKGYRFVTNVKEIADEISLEIEKDEDSNNLNPNNKNLENSGSRKIIYSVIVALLIFVFGFSIFYFWNNTVAKTEPKITSIKQVKSIAVLPFKTIDSQKDDKFLGIGIADAVITKLSQTKSIIVRQTSSVIRYADTTPEAIKVGREINVDAVLEGNIQKADGRIRVAVRLYRVQDNALLWAENFDEWETNIFAMQDSISEKVASSLSLELDYEERNNLKRNYTKNLEAYTLYNKGRYFWNNRNSVDLQKSIDFYKQAIAKDENYALAYAGLAESYVLLHTYSPQQEKDAFPKAKEAAEKALSLDNKLAEAHTALAMYKEQFEYDWDGAEKEFKLAISANPSYATAHQWYGEFLGFLGRTEESITEIEKAFELDPLSLSTNTARAFPYLASRQYDKAIEKLNLALELDKDFPLALYYLGRCFDGKKQYSKSIDQYQKAIKASGSSTYFSSALIYSYNNNGQKEDAKRVFSEIVNVAEKQPISKYVIARSFAAIGEKEKAIDSLEEAFQDRDSLMIVMNIEQIFDEIRNDPRFQKLLNEMDL